MLIVLSRKLDYVPWIAGLKVFVNLIARVNEPELDLLKVRLSGPS